MTAIKTEAWNLIQRLPEEKVGQVVAFIKSMHISYENQNDGFIEERKEAFKRLDSLNIQVPMDFDYKKELAEIRDEKYDNFT